MRERQVRFWRNFAQIQCRKSNIIGPIASLLYLPCPCPNSRRGVQFDNAPYPGSSVDRKYPHKNQKNTGQKSVSRHTNFWHQSPLKKQNLPPPNLFEGLTIKPVHVALTSIVGLVVHACVSKKLNTNYEKS